MAERRIITYFSLETDLALVESADDESAYVA
jgi:hypothetical protein